MGNKRPGGVYAITNTRTGEQYIGSTRHFGKRRGMHLFLLANGRHFNPLLQAAYVAHGPDVFSFDVIEDMGIDPDRDALFDREQHYLTAIAPAYNVCPSSRGAAGRPISAETHAKMSAGQRNRAPVSAETRAKRSANQKARWTDPEFRARMTALMTERARGPRTAKHRAAMSAYARNRPAEHAEKIAAARRGKQRGPMSAETRAELSALAFQRNGRERPVIPDGMPSVRALKDHGRVPAVPVLEVAR